MYSTAIVIPTFMRPKLLVKLLDSLLRAKIPASLIDIVVVENGGKGGADNIVKAYQNKLPMRYLYVELANLSNARNLGAKETDADVVIFFDDDLRCDVDTLVSYDASIQKHGVSCFYGGPVDIDYEEEPPHWLMRYMPYSVQGMDKGREEKIFCEPVFLGGNHAVPRQMLLEIGGYDLYSVSDDKNRSAGGEELRLQRQLLQKGCKGIYHPRAKVWHFVPKERCSISWTLNRQYRYGLTRGIFEAKDRDIEIPMLSGAPRWMWRRLLVLAGKVAILRLCYPKHREKSFAIEFEAYGIKGMIDGYRDHVRV